MKKIIYSLVIMIAAGSLFTSCIENQESAGQRAVQEAKAEYLNALAKLRVADAGLVNAEAAVKNAEAEVVAAEAAYQLLLNQAQEIANKQSEAENAYQAAKWQAEIDTLRAQADLLVKEANIALANAQYTLDTTMQNIRIAMLAVTDTEQKALDDAATNYQQAANTYLTILSECNNAKALWENAKYDAKAGYDTISIVKSGSAEEEQEAHDTMANEVVAAKLLAPNVGPIQVVDEDEDYYYVVRLTDYEALIAEQELKIAAAKEKMAAYEKAASDVDSIADLIEDLQDSVDAYEIEWMKVVEEYVLYKAQNFPEAQQAYKESWFEFVKANFPATDDNPYGDVNAEGLFNFYDLNEDGEAVAKEYAFLPMVSNDLQSRFIERVTDMKLTGVAFNDIGQGTTTTPLKSLALGPWKGSTSSSEIELALYGYTDEDKDEEEESTQIVGLKWIVEALDHYMLIVNDQVAKTTADAAKAEYYKADSLYKAHRALLEKGFDEDTGGNKDEYIKMVKSFFGLSEETQIGEDDTNTFLAPMNFAWSDSTFKYLNDKTEDSLIKYELASENCYQLWGGDTTKTEYQKLQIVLDELNKKGGLANQNVLTFNNGSYEGKATEYAKVKIALAKYKDVLNYTENVDALNNLKAMVDSAENDYIKAKLAQLDEDARYEYLRDSLTGGGEIVPYLYTNDDFEQYIGDKKAVNYDTETIKDGFWTLKGLQGTWAQTYAPRIPGMLKKCEDVEKENEQKAQYKKELIETLKEIAKYYAAYETGKGHMKEEPYKGLASEIEALIEQQQTLIEGYEDLIAVYRKALTMRQNGVDENSIKLASFEATYKALAEQLEMAKSKADYYKALYDELMKEIFDTEKAE